MKATRELSPRNLSRYYASALLLIGCLALGSHLIQRSAMGNLQGMAEIINISGRQRMLSQRIASLAAQYRLGDAKALPDLRAAIEEFESAHWRLSRGDLADDSNPNSQRLIQQLYFDGPRSVDAEVREFIATARRVAALAANDPAMPGLTASLFAESRAPLLDRLNRIVVLREQESDTKFGQLRHLQEFILAIMFVALALEARFIFQPMIRRIVNFSAEILRLASTDSLTGVANRRGFFEKCATELERMRRYDRPLSLLALDADHFKQINDTYGHAAGDAALRALSETLLGNLRPSDVLGRVGGEEFAILAPETGLEGACLLAERLRSQVAATRIEHGGHGFYLTVSIGVAEVGAQQSTIESALQAADRLMYQAKESGRNRVVSEELARRPA